MRRASVFLFILFIVAYADPTLAHVRADWEICVGQRINETLRSRVADRPTGGACATAAGLTDQQFSTVRTGKASIALPQGRALAKFLDVDERWLLCYDWIDQQFKGDLNALISSYPGRTWAHFFRVAHHALSRPADERVPTYPDPVTIEEAMGAEEIWRHSAGTRMSEAMKARSSALQKMTNQSIADELGIYSTRVSAFRKGKQSMSLTHGRRLARYLDVELDWLFDFELIYKTFGDFEALRAQKKSLGNSFFDVGTYAFERLEARQSIVKTIALRCAVPLGRGSARARKR